MNATAEKTALILSGSGYELTISPDAEQQKAELIKHAALIVDVRDPDSAAAAQNQIKKLAAMRNLVEKSRKTVKEPVLAIGKEIDAKASDFVTELISEEKRLTTAVGNYAAEVERERQRILREQEEQRRKEEAERIRLENERIAAERAAEEAKRKANEAFLKEQSDEDAKAAEAAAAKAKADADRIAAEQAAAAAEAAKPKVELAPVAPSGVKFAPDFEVEDIHALYRHNPALVAMEAKRADILTLIKQVQAANGGLPEIPGLRVFEKPVVSTR